jgi:membrane-bound lytic murein transglycosylase D
LPFPPGLEPNVAFWVNVFTAYPSSQTVLLDAGDIRRIYKVLDFGEETGEVSAWRRSLRIEREKARIARALGTAAAGRTLDLKAEERSWVRLFGDSPDSSELVAAMDRVRSQTGLRDRFREAIIRSGQYMDELRGIFREEGVPEELAYLAHVESSFNPVARSKAAAVGMWQFIASTGKRYLRVDDTLDERRDPFIAARAAARYLKSNFDSLGTWPLAITAYNHGVNGMRRAVDTIKTRDLVEIIRNYQGPHFGFASKNFYSEFLAALYVSQNAEVYFGPLASDPPMRYKTVKLERPLTFSDLIRVFNVEPDDLLAFNPSFGRALVDGRKKLPAGYALRLPPDGLLFGSAKTNPALMERF